jgi:methanogenic corrinoid protein MtbC1
MPAINDIGESMAEGDFFMPEVKISTKALKEVAEELRPYSLEQLGLSSLDVPPWTGEGDIDDIGDFLKNIVAGSREKTAAELMSMLDMLASGLDTHEFTPCKIQGAEAKQ